MSLGKASAGTAKYGLCADHGTHGLCVEIPTQNNGVVTAYIWVGNIKEGCESKAMYTIEDLNLGKVYKVRDEETGMDNFIFGLQKPGVYAFAIETEKLKVRGGKLWFSNRMKSVLDFDDAEKDYVPIMYQVNGSFNIKLSEVLSEEAKAKDVQLKHYTYTTLKGKKGQQMNLLAKEGVENGNLIELQMCVEFEKDAEPVEVVEPKEVGEVRSKGMSRGLTGGGVPKGMSRSLRSMPDELPELEAGVIMKSEHNAIQPTRTVQTVQVSDDHKIIVRLGCMPLERSGVSEAAVGVPRPFGKTPKVGGKRVLEERPIVTEPPLPDEVHDFEGACDWRLQVTVKLSDEPNGDMKRIDSSDVETGKDFRLYTVDEGKYIYVTLTNVSADKKIQFKAAHVSADGKQDLEGVEGVVTLTGQKVVTMKGQKTTDHVYELPYPLHIVANAEGEEAWVLKDTTGNMKLKLRFVVKTTKRDAEDEADMID